MFYVACLGINLCTVSPSVLLDNSKLANRMKNYFPKRGHFAT